MINFVLRASFFYGDIVGLSFFNMKRFLSHIYAIAIRVNGVNVMIVINFLVPICAGKVMCHGRRYAILNRLGKVLMVDQAKFIIGSMFVIDDIIKSWFRWINKR